MKYIINIDKSPYGNPSEDLRQYEIDIDVLRRKGNTYDSLIIDDTARVIRRIEHKNGEDYILENPIIENLSMIKIELFQGINYIYITVNGEILSTSTIIIDYLLKNDFTETYPTVIEMHSAIEQSANQITLEVSKKADADKIISLINLSPEAITINSNRISLEGKEINLTSDNISINSKNFSVDKNGNISAIGGNIGGFTLSEKNFSSNFNGIYNYNDYDLRLAMALTMGWVSENENLVDILDANGDGTVNSGDFMKIKNIILGKDTNTRELSGKLIINSEDPKNNISIYKEEDLILSLGIGGINTNAITTEITTCGIVNENYFSGIIIDGKSNTIRIINQNNENIKIDSNGFQIVNSENSSRLTPTHLYLDSGSIRSSYTYNNDTVTNNPNMYITSNGWIRRTTNTSSYRFKKNIKRIKKEKIANQEINQEINPENLYDVKIWKFKYRDEYFKNKNDKRYDKDLIGFILEDLVRKYPIAVDYEEDENGIPRPESWNVQYLIPPILYLLQEQHKEIEELKSLLKGE